MSLVSRKAPQRKARRTSTKVTKAWPEGPGLLFAFPRTNTPAAVAAFMRDEISPWLLECASAVGEGVRVPDGILCELTSLNNAIAHWIEKGEPPPDYFGDLEVTPGEPAKFVRAMNESDAGPVSSVVLEALERLIAGRDESDEPGARASRADRPGPPSVA